MPSLFNRRSRSVSTSRPPPPASSSAQSAAAQAFLANRPPQANLSASAAAAALRSMSPTPTSVHQVQTKRMLNRQNSNNSMASAPRGRPRGTLQRTPSGGSMTERTFRSPSPGRQSTSQISAPGSAQAVAPPVPSIPATYTSENVPPIPKRSHRRSASMETPPPRVLSPPPTRSAGRGQSIDRAPATGPAATAARRSVNLPKIAELERTDSRNSINFSYPRGSRPTSPAPASPSVAVGTQNGISPAETSAIQRDLAKTAAKPVKKKKKFVEGGTIEGSRLQAGSMSNKSAMAAPASTSVQQEEEEEVTLQPVKIKKKKAKMTGENTHFPDSQDETASSIASDSDTTPERPQEKRAQRASGMLLKQPSMVREDWDGEQEEQSSPTAPAVKARKSTLQAATTSTIAESGHTKKSAPAANMSRKMEEPVAPTRSSAYSAVTAPSSTPAETRKTLAPAAQITRPVSTSPSRSTRFSDRLSSDLSSGKKHEPLRAISPAKSALKHHSPAPSDASPIDGRFPHRRGSSVTPSEASDVSMDGRRKKSARVSFEENPETFTIPSENDIYAKASKDTGKKSWYGTGKQKQSVLRTIPAEEDADDVLQPRPTLPAFGSVRRSKPDSALTSTNANNELSMANRTSTASSSSSDVSTTLEPSTMNTSVSSDHALGSMIFRESQAKLSQQLPPHATPTSERDDYPDSDEGFDNNGRSVSNDAVARSTHNTSTTSDAYVPVIAIQPATPGAEDMNPTEEWSADVPGHFPSYTSPSNILYQHSAGTQDTVQPHEIATTSKELRDAEPKMLDAIAEEDSDKDSVYSDAAEDLSDLDGDGFGSINAIIRTPVQSPASKIASISPVSPGESPSIYMGATRPETNRVASWDETQSHWSGLAQQFRNSASQTRDSTTSVEEDSPQQPVRDDSLRNARALSPSAEIVPRQEKKQSRVANTAPSSTRDSQLDSIAEDNKRITNTKPRGGFRSSMRSEPDSAHTLRGQSNTMGSSVPAQSRSALQKKSRTAAVTSGPAPRPLRRTFSDDSDTMPSPAPRPTSMRRTFSDDSDIASPSAPAPTPARSPAPARAPITAPAPAPASAPARKPAQRTFSNDSDSDTSFKRVRKDRKPTDTKYTMKRSMRGGPTEATTAVAPVSSSRRDIRSISPVDRRPLSPSGGQRLRMSMRASQDLDTREQRSSSLFSKARKAMSPTRAPSIVAPVAKPKSRLADSDDEVDVRRSGKYKSRFAASSDEDEPEPMRPVRGIPRKATEGDSTDLDDSSDDQRRKTQPASKRLAITIPPPTQSISSPPMSPNTAKKTGFWGRLRSKKNEDEPIPGNTIAERNGTKSDIDPGKKMSKNDKQLGFSSTAQKEALIEQTRQKLEAAQNVPTSPTSKLQRRGTPQRILSDSWPLPPKLSAADDGRPSTADAADTTARPGLGNRQPTSDTVLTSGGTPIYGRGGKKKKFPMLRRAFGLHD